jgi:hypothetical protein
VWPGLVEVMDGATFRSRRKATSNREVYLSLGYEVTILPMTNFSERADFVLSRIGHKSAGNLRHRFFSVPQRRFLDSPADPTSAMIKVPAAIELMEKPWVGDARDWRDRGSIAPRVRSAVRRDNLASLECVQPTRIDSGQYDDPVCDEVFSFDSSFRSRGGSLRPCASGSM